LEGQLLSEKRQAHRSHVASNKYRSLHKDFYNTWQISQFTTQIDNKAYKNKKKTLFGIFIKQFVCNKKFNIEYLQLSRVDFIHFLFMHWQTSHFHIQVKMNSQIYSNPIPSDFEPIITHQVPIPWIFNKQSCIKFKSLKITNESCSIPRYKFH